MFEVELVTQRQFKSTSIQKCVPNRLYLSIYMRILYTFV